MNYNNPRKHRWLPPVVALTVTAMIVGGIAILLCNRHKPQERARAVAEKALLFAVDRPETVKILAVSDVDSVFGHDYISMDEKVAISMAMMKVNEKVMQATDNFERLDHIDSGVSGLMERQMSAMTALRSLTSQPTVMAHGKPLRDFTGWKVRIEYQATGADNKPYRSERWFFLDREATCVVKSFEIPLI